MVAHFGISRETLRPCFLFLVLDEPSEGLDDRTAGQLMAAQDARLRGRMLLVISHRDRDFGIVERVVRLS